MLRRKKHAKHLDEIDDLKVVRRLLAKVNISTEEGLDGLPQWCWGCWNWQGCKDDEGYGQIHYCGQAHWVHRISHAIWCGKIPARKTVNHECFNHSCCNPFHLSLMTHQKNSGIKKPKP